MQVVEEQSMWEQRELQKRIDEKMKRIRRHRYTRHPNLMLIDDNDPEYAQTSVTAEKG